jgi:hypothetical protein
MQSTQTLPGAAFRATVERGGIRVPTAVVAALEAGRRPLVTVTVGERTYRTRLVPRRGEYRLPGGRAPRGDDVEVSIELDRDPRVVAVPTDLAAALEAAPGALHYFEALSYSRQRAFVLDVEAAPTPETRARRVELAVARLGDGG